MKLKRLCTAVLTGLLAAASLYPLGDTHLPLVDTAITAEAAGTMRRPCSNEQPMLIVHIDTWNVADPAKIIALIPDEIKPYCVFNISMSINWSNDTHE